MKLAKLTLDILLVVLFCQCGTDTTHVTDRLSYGTIELSEPLKQQFRKYKLLVYEDLKQGQVAFGFHINIICQDSSVGYIYRCDGMIDFIKDQSINGVAYVDSIPVLITSTGVFMARPNSLDSLKDKFRLDVKRKDDDAIVYRCIYYPDSDSIRVDLDNELDIFTLNEKTFPF